MKKTILLLFMVALIACSCSKYKYWDVSKFNLVTDALTDGENITLIYGSNGPDFNNDLKYYYQYIVLNQAGDTINVLTAINSTYARKNIEGEKFIFLSPDGIKGKAVLSHVVKQDKPIKKVAYDPQFNYMADNNYPTIIGLIAEIN